jgi:hypothetical protein
MVIFHTIRNYLLGAHKIKELLVNALPTAIRSRLALSQIVLILHIFHLLHEHHHLLLLLGGIG